MSLLFKREFFEAIRDGRKTQTVRWWRRAMVRPGRDMAVPFLTGGRLHIESIDPIDGLADLTETDASADGFASLAEMQAGLRRIYPALPDDQRSERRLFRVRFRFVPT